MIHQVPHRGCELHADRSRANDGERQHLAPPLCVRDERGVLERRQDAVPDSAAILEPLHDQGVFLHAGDAEVVGHASGRDDEVVVLGVAVLGPHDLLLDVDGLDFRTQESEPGFRERHAQRVRDRVRRKLARRDLIEEWREQREVRAVDERDLRLAAPEVLLQMTNEMEPSEPAAHDDDALRHELFATSACSRSSSSR